MSKPMDSSNRTDFTEGQDMGKNSSNQNHGCRVGYLAASYKYKTPQTPSKWYFRAYFAQVFVINPVIRHPYRGVMANEGHMGLVAACGAACSACA
jgi:hypothetical protein